jgi:hypothetical protein
MNLATEILAWSEKQPLWRRDLMRRLALTPTLTDPDAAEVLELIAAANRGAAAQVQARPLARTDLPRVGSEPVELVRVAELVNVNGLADGQEIVFGPQLNLLYGGNGAGKTGYTRVFKRSCRAVDDERLLGDVYSGDTTPPQATIAIATATGEQVLRVDLTRPGPPVLSTINVFDGRCAGVYATQETIAFTPAPLRIFDRLAAAQLALRETVDARLAELERQRPALGDIAPETEARRLADTLSATSDIAAVASFTTLGEIEMNALAALDVELAQLQQSGPEALAARAEREAAAIGTVVARIEQLEAGLDDNTVTRLAETRTALAVTAEAVELARTGAFAAESVAETGSPGWRMLWEAARKFAEHDCGRKFPPPEGATCPLCQQPLNAEAGARLSRFEAFVQSTVERDAAAARTRLTTELAAIEALRVGEVEQLPGVSVVALEDIELHRLTKAFLDGAAIRAAALATGTSADLPEPPTEQLRRLVTARHELAAHQRALADPAKHAAVARDARELRARKQLGERLPDLRSWHATLGEIALLQKVRRALDTTAITNKQRELTRAAVSEELRRRMHEELDALGFGHLQVELGCRGSRGQTKMRAELTGTDAPPECVLSSGELRAVSLAFFLAEVACSGQTDPIVVDDPTDSFAPEHRRHFARRLLEESARRQVVVLTHDLALIYELEQRAENAGVECRSQSVRRVAGRPGVTHPDLPWVAARVKQRRGDLNARLQTIEKLNRTGDERYEDEVRLAVELLRETWERSFEERVLNGAMTRFEPGVHTQQLTKSAIDPELVRRMDAGMTETSQWVHDQPRGGHATIPSPEELREALAHLDEFLALAPK